MKDERCLLIKKLKKMGIDKFKAYSIAINAGSSQCTINREYLINIGLDENILKDVLILIGLFYTDEILFNEYIK